MPPLDLAGYLIAVLMTAVAVWRMPAALWGDEEDKRRRALWGCYAGFAAALWTKTQVVRIGLNDSPVTDLSVLIKHYTATLAILAILSYIVAIYGQYPDAGDVPRHVRFARAVQQVAAKASVATLILLTVLFFTVVDRSVPSDRFVADHAGQWGATLYMSVFYLYLGAASAVCAYQWALATAGAGLRHLRVGLAMMTFAMFIGVAYTVSRTLFLWVSVVDQPSAAFALEFDEVTEAAQVVLFTFFAVGASVPALSKGRRRAKLWRAQTRLHRLEDLGGRVGRLGGRRAAGRGPLAVVAARVCDDGHRVLVTGGARVPQRRPDGGGLGAGCGDGGHVPARLTATRFRRRVLRLHNAAPHSGPRCRSWTPRARTAPPSCPDPPPPVRPDDSVTCPHGAGPDAGQPLA
ncbi:hypothetical protein ACWD6R_34280 [Streptomyces sp. NPDC005151]